jgi:hypothetical protein
VNMNFITDCTYISMFTTLGILLEDLLDYLVL